VSPDQLLKGSGTKRCEAAHMGFFTSTPQRHGICHYYLLLEHRSFLATVGIARKYRVRTTGTYRTSSLDSELCCGLVERCSRYLPCHPRVLHQCHTHSPVLARPLPDEVRLFLQNTRGASKCWTYGFALATPPASGTKKVTRDNRRLRTSRIKTDVSKTTYSCLLGCIHHMVCRRIGSLDEALCILNIGA
jgi:hypothetical protein